MTRRTMLLLCTTLFLITIPYLSCLGGPFVWDDRPLILGEAGKIAVQRLGPLDEYFLHPFWRPGAHSRDTISFYRPLVTLSYALDYAVHGENPAGFHLTNLSFHLLNCLLLFLLLRRFSAPPPISAALVLLWGLFPRLTESVTWISGRTDVMATTFSLLALLCWPRRVLAALFLLLGLFCKEVTAAAALAVALCEVDLYRREDPTHPAGLPAGARRGRVLFLRLLPLGVAAVVYGALRESVLSAVEHDPGGPAALLLRLGQSCEAVGWYALMVLCPWRPATQIGLWGKLDPVPAVLGGVLLVSAAVLGVRSRGRLRQALAGSPGTRIGAVLGLTALALVLHVVPVPVDVVATDRFLYVPLLGAALCLGPALGRRGPRAGRAFLAGAGVLAVTFAAAVYQRNLDWGDEVRFWVDALRRTRPDNGRPLLELGNVYAQAGLCDDAVRLFDLAAGAVQDTPGQRGIALSARSNEANCLAQLGRYDEARSLRRWLIRIKPGVAKQYHDLGLLELSQGHFGEARAALHRALAVYPTYQAALSLQHLAGALEQAPAPGDPVGRAEYLTRMGRRPEAEAAWVAVVAASGPGTGIGGDEVRKAVAYLSLWGSPAHARAAWRRYRDLAPGAADAPGMELLIADREDLARRLIAARAAWQGGETKWITAAAPGAEYPFVP